MLPLVECGVAGEGGLPCVAHGWDISQLGNAANDDWHATPFEPKRGQLLGCRQIQGHAPIAPTQVVRT